MLFLLLAHFLLPSIEGVTHFCLRHIFALRYNSSYEIKRRWQLGKDDTMRVVRLLLLLPLLLLPSLVHAQDTPPLPLTQTFTAANGLLSFQYPGGWVTDDAERFVILATDSAALSIGSELGRGQMRASLFAAPLASLPDMPPNPTLEDVLHLLTTVSNRGDCDPIATFIPLTLKGRDALRADQTCSTTENLYVVVRLDEQNVGVLGASALVGNLPKFRATLLEVAATLSLYDPSAPARDTSVDLALATETYTSSTGAITLSYPAGWRVEESGGLIGMTDSDEPIFSEQLPGHLVIRIALYAPGAIPGILSTSPANVARWFTSDAPIPLPYGEPETFRLNDREVARARYDTETFDSQILVVPLDDGAYAVFNVFTGRGGMRAIEPLLYATALSLRVNLALLGTPEVTAEPAETATLAPTHTPTPEPTATSSPSATPTEPPTPTHTPAPEATREATEAAPGVDLPQTYAAEAFIFRYPADWNVLEQTIGGQDYLIFTPAESFSFGIPQPGAPFAIILVSSVSAATSAPLASDLVQRPLDAMTALNAASPDVPFDDPTPLQSGGRPGARTDALYPQFENSAFIVLINDDDYAYMNVFAAPGEMAALEEIVLATLATFDIREDSFVS